MKKLSLLLATLFGAGGCMRAQPSAPLALQPSAPTTLRAADLDAQTFAEWSGGAETQLTGKAARGGPQSVVWTDATRGGLPGLSFGNSKTPGPRHLRIGFVRPIEVGSVLVRGGGALSVLKENARYPGDLGNEADWTPAQRLVNGQIESDEVAQSDYALWVLPPNTRTRALRFSHLASATDASYAGHLGGASLTNERADNLAPLAQVGASSNAQEANLVNNGSHDGWRAWSNMEMRATNARAVVSRRDPESLTLTWPAPVKISGLQLLWPGFSAATLQSYEGSAQDNPRDSADGWRDVADISGLNSGYRAQLTPNRIEFGRTLTTRALRLKITAPSDSDDPRLKERARAGQRVWLGEIMALSPLGEAAMGAAAIQTSALQAATGAVAGSGHPPIPVKFRLDKPGLVTLVIEKMDGTRVRNLISETPFAAGENTAWWDGTDDLGRDVDAANHGVYRVPAQFVAPGTYRVRGLVHDAVSTHYEFSVYSPGHPPWQTADKTGGWTTNHTPPQAALWVPGSRAPGGKPLIFLGSYVSEGGSGLAWVDENGVKRGGQNWVGGTWTGAPYLAADNGPNAAPGAYGYAASVWKTAKGSQKVELRVTALTAKGDQEIVKWQFDPRDVQDAQPEISGLAVRDGLIAVSLPLQKKILFARVDAGAGGKLGGHVLATAPLDDARGLWFDGQGRLLVLVGRQLRRYAVSDSGALGASTMLIGQGLQDPRGISVSSQGDIYIADWGTSHQVKVFSASGQGIKTFGRAGAPKAGPYDELHMNHPQGVAVDGNGRLWVAENDFLPKRVSVWNADGTLWKAFYGPGKYGGGGTLDSNDATRFLYAQPTQGTLEFQLNWQTGASKLTGVLVRREPGDMELPFRAATPELPLRANGRRYLTNSFNTNATQGHGSALIYLETNGVAQPVAAMGRASQWIVLQGAPFKAGWPAGAKDVLYAWADGNGDGRAQPAEVRYRAAANVSGVTVMPDLSFAIARVGEQAMRFAPTGFNAAGAPLYDVAGGETLAQGVAPNASSGGDQVLTNGAQGWSVITLGIGPFAAQSVSGARGGAAAWSYPSLWPGLHASHSAPEPNRPGEMLGTTRLLGEFFTPKGSAAGPLWALNSNMGQIYLFTADGLFVQTLFQDFRSGQSWAMPTAPRGTNLDDLTLSGENFWPTITQTPDGEVYLVSGRTMSLVRLDGLDTLRRLPDSQIQVGAAELQAAQTQIINQEAGRQQNQGNRTLQVALRRAAPVVDGQLNDWSGAKWVDIDKSGTAAFFNSKTRPYDISGAVAVSGDRLFAAYKTGNDKLLRNSGAVPLAPFKTGGALDLMLGTNPGADPNRRAPVAGDLRLLVTQVGGKTKAVLYRAVVPGATDPVPFSSPDRTVSFDEVRDVSSQVQLAGSGGNYEFSIPLSVLGLQPRAGQSISGDIGVLRGDGDQTTARVYWSNKATSIVSDVPSEAQLTPQLWGKLEFAAG